MTQNPWRHFITSQDGASINCRRKVSLWSLLQFTRQCFIIIINMYYLFAQQFSTFTVFPLQWTPRAPLPSWFFLPIDNRRDDHQKAKPMGGGWVQRSSVSCRVEHMCPWEHKIPTVRLIGHCFPAWLCAKLMSAQGPVSWGESEAFASVSKVPPAVRCSVICKMQIIPALPG